MIPDPIRHRRPSASAFLRIAACNASFALGQIARDEGNAPPDTAYSAHGDAVHAYMHSRSGWDALTREQKDTVERMEAQAQAVALEWCPDPAHVTGEHREMRLFMHRDGGVTGMAISTDEILFSGQFDYGVLNRDHGICMDYKSLPGDVEPAAGNLQLLALAVLMAHRWNLSSVRVAIIQPLRGSPSIADFDEQSLRDAGAYCRDLVARADFYVEKFAEFPETAHNPVHFKPGPACKFCDARLICPALKATVDSAITEMQTPVADKAHMAQTLMAMDTARLEKLFTDWLPRAKALVDAVESTFKAQVEAGLHPEWEIAEKPGRRVVEDVAGAYAALPLSAGAFLSSCSLSLPDIEGALAAHEGTSLAKAKTRVNDLLAAFITKTTTKKLQRKKAIG